MCKKSPAQRSIRRRLFEISFDFRNPFVEVLHRFKLVKAGISFDI